MQDILFQDSTLIEKELDDVKRTLTQYISTRSLDRGRDIVEPDGVVLTEYLKNPVVLYMHDYKLPIGTSLWQKPDSKGVLAKTRFGSVPFADDIYSLHKEGILNAWSIGFKPKEWDYDRDNNITTYKKWELYEYSSVTIPMNQDALDEAKAIVKSEKGLLIVNKGIISFEKEKSINEQTELIKALSKRVEELENAYKSDEYLTSLESLEKEVAQLKTKISEIIISNIVKTGISGLSSDAIRKELSRDISFKIQ